MKYFKLVILVFTLLLIKVSLAESVKQRTNLHPENQGSSLVANHKVHNDNLRILHFVLRDVSFDTALSLVDKASTAGFNTIQILLTDGVTLDNAPWTPRKNAWSKRELLAWSLYAQSHGINVVPEIKFLTHQEKLFQKKISSLMYNAVTYDPQKKEVYKKVFLLIDEIIETLKPTALHIGHDEVVGWNSHHARKILNKNEKMLPSSLFLSDVLTIHDYLKKHNIETWMWGDMLISPQEFPSMLKKHLHGGFNGYGKQLRHKIPKDIVICDWHYFDKQKNFPTLTTMQKEGFHVIGSTWKKKKTIHNFSHYASKHNAYGMMATTWFHVQRKEWNIIDNIINTSGRIFLKDFPHEE